MIVAAPSFVGRVQELERAREVLLADDAHGIFVHGAPGVGTTAFVNELERTLGDRVAVLHTRGSVGAGEVPYGAVMPLLRDGDDEALSHPLQALRTAVDHLVTAGGAQSVVLVVHGAQYVDPWSALMLGTLAGRPGCSLVVVAESVAALPQDVAVLVREGALVPLEIAPLTMAEAEQLLRERLGPDVPARVVEELWHVTRGNVRSLTALADHVDVAGPGALQDLCRWTIRRRPALEAALPTAHAALAAPEARLLEILSLADGLSLGHAARIADGEVLDRLLTSGLAHVDSAHGQRVRPVDAVVAAAVRGLGGAGRRLQLLSTTFPAGEPEDPALVLPYARWAASCGTELSLGTALTAARLAMDAIEPSCALAILDAVAPGERTAAHAITRGIALLMGPGGVEGATQLRSVTRLAPDDEVAAAQVAWALGACPDLPLVDDLQRWGTAGRLLLDLVPAAWRPRLPARRPAVAACADLSTGGALPAVAPLQAEYDRLARPTTEDGTPQAFSAAWRTAVTWRLREAATLTGAALPADVLDAAAAATELTLDGRTHGRLSGLLLAFLTGEDPGPETFALSPAAAGRHRDVTGAVLADLCRGLRGLRTGRPDAAVPVLTALVPGLHESDPAGVLPLALAGAALGAARSGDAAGARELLKAYHATGPVGRWLPRRVATLLALLTGTELRDVGAAAALAREGLEDLSAGRPLPATRFLLAAALDGMPQAVPALVTAATRLDGGFAAIGRAVGAGMATDDAAGLLAAAESAESGGHDEVATRVAALAEVAALRTGDEDSARAARAFQARFDLRSRRSLPVAGKVLPALTRREREIALLVCDGMANQDLAEALHLSVRTVEGHVSRIYAKLGVATRAALAELVAP